MRPTLISFQIEMYKFLKFSTSRILSDKRHVIQPEIYQKQLVKRGWQSTNFIELLLWLIDRNREILWGDEYKMSTQPDLSSLAWSSCWGQKVRSKSMLTVILMVAVLAENSNAYLFSFSPHSYHFFQPTIHTASPSSFSRFPHLADRLFTKPNEYRENGKKLQSPGQKNVWSKRVEEEPLERKTETANVKSSQENKRDVSIEEKQLSLIANINVYRAMKTKEDVFRAIRTRERKNYFDHLAFMSRLTGKWASSGRGEMILTLAFNFDTAVQWLFSCITFSIPFVYRDNWYGRL